LKYLFITIIKIQNELKQTEEEWIDYIFGTHHTYTKWWGRRLAREEKEEEAKNNKKK
jgi:hypothetical protein